MAGVELILPLGAVATKLRGSSWLFHAWESLELASLNAALVSNMRSSRSGCGGELRRCVWLDTYCWQVGGTEDALLA